MGYSVGDWCRGQVRYFVKGLGMGYLLTNLSIWGLHTYVHTYIHTYIHISILSVQSYKLLLYSTQHRCVLYVVKCAHTHQTNDPLP